MQNTYGYLKNIRRRKYSGDYTSYFDNFLSSEYINLKRYSSLYNIKIGKEHIILSEISIHPIEVVNYLYNICPNIFKLKFNNRITI